MFSMGAKMKNIIIQPTETAHWYALIGEAQEKNACFLEEDIESYLVFLLMRFNTQAELAESVLAVDFLTSMNSSGKVGIERFQALGDKSLLFSGFFPEQADKKNVSEDYFIDMGRGAYQSAANLTGHNTSELFAALSEAFIIMRNILYSIKCHS